MDPKILSTETLFENIDGHELSLYYGEGSISLVGTGVKCAGGNEALQTWKLTLQELREGHQRISERSPLWGKAVKLLESKPQMILCSDMECKCWKLSKPESDA